MAAYRIFAPRRLGLHYPWSSGLRRLDLIARVKLDAGGDTDSYYLYDGLGSTTGLTDGAGGVTDS